MVRGVPEDEKRRRILEIFSETKDFFMLKEVEKMAYKKGVPLMAVKDVLQGLIDDDLVRLEKIGTSNYYWAFPSQKQVNRNNVLEKLNAERESTNKKVEELRVRLEAEQMARADGERTGLISRYEDLKKERDELFSALEKYNGCDPAIYEEKKIRVAALKTEVNKITDDLFTVQSYVCNKFDVDRREFLTSFGISETLDYVE
eukprot:jgi/Antlo1/1989/2209